MCIWCKNPEPPCKKKVCKTCGGMGRKMYAYYYGEKGKEVVVGKKLVRLLKDQYLKRRYNGISTLYDI